MLIKPNELVEQHKLIKTPGCEVKVEQLIEEAEKVENVSLEDAGAVIIFILVGSCFSKGSGRCSRRGLEVARKQEQWKK